jgi:hypothetical protein
MAKLALTLAVLVVLCGAALAKEKAEVKWSCKKSGGLSFKAKLGGAPMGKGTKQYPVGGFGFEDTTRHAASTQLPCRNVQGVIKYNGYVITPLITSLCDGGFGFEDSITNGTNGTNTSTTLTILQRNHATDYFKCKQRRPA